MKKIALIRSYHVVLWASFFSLPASFLMENCDITDHLTRPVFERALCVWGLLDLAENRSIVDHSLFYDELCQASLKLCNEVIQLQESNYLISPVYIDRYTELVNLLHAKFTRLPEHTPEQKAHHHAVSIILYYSQHFLKNNLSIKANIEAA